MITAVNNKKVKELVALKNKAKLRREKNVFLVEGTKMFEEAPEELIQEVYVSESYLDKQGASKQQASENHNAMSKLKKVGYETVTDEVFAKISDTMTPQGILCIVGRKQYQLQELLKKQAPLLVLLEDIQDPGNLGTIIRTGEGAGIDGVIVTKDTADIYSPKTVRATMGSIYRVPFLETEDMITTVKELKNRNIHVYAAHLKGQDYYGDANFSEGTAFLIGNEGNGLKTETADAADRYIKIPMEGKVESLNAAIATSLLMYEAKRQRK